MLIKSITGSSNQDNEAPTSRVVQPLTSKSTNNPGYVAPKVNPVKQVQAPKQGFKIGDIIPAIGQIAGNAVTEVEHMFKPVTLSNGIKLSTPQAKPSNAVMSIKPDLGNGTSQPSAKTTENKKSLQDKQQFVNNLNNSQTLQQIKQLAIDPLSLKANPKKVLSDYVEGVKGSITTAGLSLRKVFTNDTKKAPTASKQVGAALKTAPEVVGAVLSPVTSLFSAANDIPVLGSISKVINVAFSALGEGGSFVGEKFVDQLPVSAQIKNDIKPGIKEIFALAAQIVIGGKLTELTPTERGGLIEKYGVDDAITIENKAKELANTQLHQLKVGENTPQQIIDHVIANNLEKTADGQAMLRTAMEAQKQGLTIDVDLSKDQQMINQYRETHTGLLNADNVREMYKPEGYNRINSAEFHDRASTLTNKIFKEDVSKLKPGDEYLFTAGSSGAGKSKTFLNLNDFKAGLDGNFSSDSSLKKLDEVIKTGAKPTISFVYRDPIDAWDNGVLKRATDPENGRVVPIQVFLDNLEGSRAKTLEAVNKYGSQINLEVVDNSKGFRKAEMANNPVEFLKGIKYNIEDVKEQILKSTIEKIQNGTINEDTGKALLGKEYGQELELQSEAQHQSPVAKNEATTLVEEAIRYGDLEAAKSLYEDIPKKGYLPSFEELKRGVERTQDREAAQANNEGVKAVKESYGQYEKTVQKMKNFLRMSGEKKNSEGTLFREHIPEKVFGVSTDQIATDLGMSENQLMDKMNGELDTQNQVVPKDTKEVPVPRSSLPVGEGVEKVSKLEARMKGVLDKVTPEQAQELGLSTYKQMNRADTISNAAKFVVDNPEKAIKVLKGEIDAPSGIPPEAIYVALTKYAEKDLTLATKLQSLQATALGQRLGLLAEIDKDSPVKILNDIYKVREENVSKRAGKALKQVEADTIKEIKNAIKKQAPSKYDWSNFIKEIQC